jgi:hypothetical protein
MPAQGVKTKWRLFMIFHCTLKELASYDSYSEVVGSDTVSQISLAGIFQGVPRAPQETSGEMT